MHPAIKSSFFLKFLVVTSILIHLYLLLQSCFHTFNIHVLDEYVRWYPFKANPWLNTGIVMDSLIILAGLFRILKNGKAGFSIYFAGKWILIIAYLVMIYMEYRLSGIDFPFILIPVLILIQMIYPILLYLYLRHSERTAKQRI